MNIQKTRSNFPQLQIKVNNHPLVYLDNAATTLKPKVVIDATTEYYSHEVAEEVDVFINVLKKARDFLF